jgi:hypothetical protein
VVTAMPPCKYSPKKIASGEADFSCEGRDRTYDLRVMSPTSYRCSTSRRLNWTAKIRANRLATKCFNKKFQISNSKSQIPKFCYSCTHVFMYSYPQPPLILLSQIRTPRCSDIPHHSRSFVGYITCTAYIYT